MSNAKKNPESTWKSIILFSQQGARLGRYLTRNHEISVSWL